MSDGSVRDIVVVGTSAGGVTALESLFAALPAGLEAAVFVVLHLPADTESLLPAILTRAGELTAAQPHDRDPIENGKIYVAPPDRHLIVKQSGIRVLRGPRENLHRPAIDVLFRSAALAYGSRVIGVLLTGADDDGAAGLSLIRERGGVTIVQDPADSAHPQMPESALRAFAPDFVRPIREIGSLIRDVVAGDALPVPGTISNGPVDRAMKASEEGGRIDVTPYGAPTAFSCPECNGTLWEMNEGGALSYRCRVGHSYSLQTMIEAQSESVERALWEAVRVLEESASLSRRIAHRSDVLRKQLLVKAEQRESYADVLRKILLNGD